MATTPSLTIY